ncbi:MAG TPA: hypothetical protein VMZ22_13570 [Acidimicrobiales bacterium]|nr:hypothetical protein [Acidimicrobiales bacterium]
MSWLVLSLVLSLVLTVVLNVAVRAFPGQIRRLETPAETARVRVFAPWKTMLVASIALTVIVNLVALLAR